LGGPLMGARRKNFRGCQGGGGDRGERLMGSGGSVVVAGFGAPGSCAGREFGSESYKHDPAVPEVGGGEGANTNLFSNALGRFGCGEGGKTGGGWGGGCPVGGGHQGERARKFGAVWGGGGR